MKGNLVRIDDGSADHQQLRGSAMSIMDTNPVGGVPLIAKIPANFLENVVSILTAPV